MRRPGIGDYVLYAAVLIGAVWLFFALPPLGLATNDEGAKFVQMKNFYLYHTLPIQYPAQSLGFGLPYVLRERWLFVERMGRMYCTFPPLFTFLSALAYPLLGDRVTRFLPLLAFLLSFVLLSRVLRRLTENKVVHYAMLFAFLFGSPLLTYSIAFFEHLPSVLMVVCGLYFMVRYFRTKGWKQNGHKRVNLFLSGFCLGAGALFRTEMLFLVVAYLAALGIDAMVAGGTPDSMGARTTLTMRTGIRYAWAPVLGAAIPIAGNVTFNCIAYHHPWLHFATANGSRGFHQSAGWFLAIPTALLIGAIAVGLVWRRFRPDPLGRADLLGFLAVLWLWSVAVLPGVGPVASFLLRFPATLLVLYGIRGRSLSNKGAGSAREEPSRTIAPTGSIISWTVVIFLLLVSYFMHGNPDPSVRFCLPAVPLVLVFVAAEEKRIFTSKPAYALLTGLLLVSTAFNFQGLKNDIWRWIGYNAQRVEFLRQHTSDRDVVVFSGWNLIEHVAPLFFERICLVARDSEELTEIAGLLRARGVAAYYYWTEEQDPSWVRPDTTYPVARYDFSPHGFAPQYHLFRIGPARDSFNRPTFRR